MGAAVLIFGSMAALLFAVTSAAFAQNIPGVSEALAASTGTQPGGSPTVATETAARTVEEGTSAGQPIGAPVTTTDPGGGTLTYSLGGADAASFAIDASSGQLRTKAALDYETRSRYGVTITATSSGGLEVEIEVTITVTNVDEPGTVTFFPAQPRVWVVQRATLSDPDGNIRSVSWEWERSSDQVAWTSINISGASYVAPTTDEGMYIRARASYRDGQGRNKSAVAVASHVVAAREAAPDITIVDVVTGLSIPWDLTFTPDGTMLFTQRSGVLSARLTDGTVQTITADLSDLFAQQEAGLMAIVVDPGFATNRRFYTCQTNSSSTAEVIAWTINDGYTSATRANDPLVGDIPAARRHSGCRLRFGPQNYLWIATGDGLAGTAPQNLGSLGGKVLRVDASTGNAAPNNPFGTRVYSYGHRNPQGLARRPGTNEMWVVEHGPDVDDEINLLTAGGNYGWNPVPGYNEQVPMTDLDEFPSAVEAKWSSGDPTLAASGGIFLQGADWKQWNGRLAVATLKEVSLRIFRFDSAGAFVSHVYAPGLYVTYGRLRTPQLGPEGALYITTSNGSGDRIIKVVPSLPPAFASATESRVVAENNAPSAVVASVTATDPEGRALTYALGGPDADSFSLVNASSGRVRANISLNHEYDASHEVVVTATDQYGLSDSVRLTIVVGDVPEPPEIDGAATHTIAENGAPFVGSYTATDPEGRDTEWSLEGTHQNAFELSDSGDLSFKDTNIPNFEQQSTYRVTVQATEKDDGDAQTRELRARLAVTITITDVPEPPVISGPAEVTVDEGHAGLVGAYTKRDPDSTTTNWGQAGSTAALSGSDADSFEFNKANGRLTFTSPPDYEDGGGRYEVTLHANDGSLSGALQIVVNVTNLEEPGMLTVIPDQGVNGGTLTATLTDPDMVATQTWKWQRSSSTSGPWTDISGATASTYTAGADDVNHYLRAHVTYTDGSGTDTVILTTTTAHPIVNDAMGNAPPVPPDPLRQVDDVPENAPAGRNVVRIVFTDPEGEQLTYSLVSDEFAIHARTGQITVKQGARLNYEDTTSYPVTVRAADPFGADATAALTIGISDVNEPPTANDDAESAPEDGSVTIDVLFNDTDPENKTLTVTSLSRPRNGSVTLNSDGTVTYTPRANYHGSDTFTYRAREVHTEPGVSALTSRVPASVSLTIESVNDAPTFASTTAERSVPASAEEGDNVGAPVRATDIDAGDTLTYDLSGARASSFDIDGSGQITVATTDVAAQDTYSLIVEARDGAGATATITVTISVTRAPIGGPPVNIIGGFVPGGLGPPPGPTPSEADFEWTVERDIEELDAGNDTPTGMWSDGTALWLADNPEGAGDGVYAYDLESGERLEGIEFLLSERNRAPRGIWSDRTTMWVSDSGQERLFAYDLASGQRVEGREIELDNRNGDARGIWGGEQTVWVLDSARDSLFAYDIMSGELRAEYALDSLNGDPHGIWSDGVTVWVSDHGEKDLLAYRLPTPDVEGGGEGLELQRVNDEDFTELSQESNNSPRGIWSDGDVMYVADANDDKVYTYNMPDAIDARLSSLTLEGIDIGEFDPGRTAYEGDIGEGVTETAVTAEAMQRRTDVTIDPPDADGDGTNGHQVALAGVDAITVTVTSADGTREKVYRVGLRHAGDEPWPHCLRGEIAMGFSLVVYEGGTVEDVATCAQSRDAVALYALHDGAYVSYIIGAPDFVNQQFVELYPDGLPALTVLVASSSGPSSDDPVGGVGVPRFWPDCLRGEITEGFSLVLYGGGSTDELATCADRLSVTALYALAGGEWVSYILGAPDFVNQSFYGLFPEGLLPAATPLVAKSDGPRDTDSEKDSEAGN